MELATAVALTGTLLLFAPPRGGAEAEALARRVQERHRKAADLTARFEQTYRSGVLGREVTERGVVSLKPPGRMHWEYQEPEKKLFVSDGKSFYFYVPADRQVIVREQVGEQGIPGLLLSGRSDILATFEVALEPGESGLKRLRLVPRQPDAEVERVYLDVDDSARIRAIEVFDAQGNRSRFRFDRIRENAGLPDSLFQFRIPRGVEVITG